MRKKYWLFAIVLAAALMTTIGLASCSPAVATVNSSGDQTGGISVTGEGKVTVVPDIVSLSLGIEAQETSVVQAQAKASEAMNQVMNTLTANGVAKKDIKTQYFNIYQVTRWDDKSQQQEVIGYRVTNMVTAKIRDVNKAGEIIDKVAAASGDLTRINGISFTVDNPTAYYEEARKKAMEDAKNKAGQLAQLAGVALGKPTYIAEGSQAYPPIIYASKGMEIRDSLGSAPTPISPGETDITLTVQVIYAILK